MPDVNKTYTGIQPDNRPYWAIGVQAGTGNNMLLGPFDTPDEAFSRLDQMEGDQKFEGGGFVTRLEMVERRDAPDVRQP